MESIFYAEHISKYVHWQDINLGILQLHHEGYNAAMI